MKEVNKKEDVRIYNEVQPDVIVRCTTDTVGGGLRFYVVYLEFMSV